MWLGKTRAPVVSRGVFFWSRPRAARFAGAVVLEPSQFRAYHLAAAGGVTNRGFLDQLGRLVPKMEQMDD